MASQTITGPDLQYTQDNKHCYAYSGAVSCAFNTETTLLEFQTGSPFHKMLFDFGINDILSDQATEISYRIYFNDIVVMYRRDEVYGSVGVKSATMLATTLHFIIPPDTAVKITAKQTDGQAHDSYAMLTGRVYEYLPVRN